MRKIALVFPGQGSQYLGMFKDLNIIEDKKNKDFESLNPNRFN